MSIRQHADWNTEQRAVKPAETCEQRRSGASSRSLWKQQHHLQTGSVAEALLWAALRLQALSDGALSIQTGLTADWARLPPLVCREAQGAAPAVAAVRPQDLRAVWRPWGAAAAPHLPAQPPGGGEAPAGQTHQCGISLLQLLSGGGEDGQGGLHHTHWRRERREERGRGDKVMRVKAW